MHAITARRCNPDRDYHCNLLRFFGSLAAVILRFFEATQLVMVSKSNAANTLPGRGVEEEGTNAMMREVITLGLTA